MKIASIRKRHLLLRHRNAGRIFIEQIITAVRIIVNSKNK